jgi:glycosyltransferase involved in cell wall biosynthesis
MISICTTIWKQEDSLETFVRSLVGMASDKNFEIVVVDDEESCKDKILELQKEFPQIVRVPHTKKDKVKFARKLVRFYKKIGIFGDYINGMNQTISDYSKGKVNLWLPMGHNFNLAASVAKGDTLVFMPADYLCFFDISKLEVEYGHFDWIDVSSVEPHPDMNILKSFTKQEQFKEFTDEILDWALKHNLATVQGQHGSRIISRARYQELCGFDDRWFTRALGEDLFNDKCRNAMGWQRLASNYLFLTNPYVGALETRLEDFVYLSPAYGVHPDNHLPFVERIKQWMN